MESMKARARSLLLVMALVAMTLMGAAVPSAVAQPEGDRSAECIDGVAYVPELDGHPILETGEFPCDNVDLVSWFTNDEIGGGIEVGDGRGSDVWGWMDPATGREYVIAGLEVGTSFIDITDPYNPVYLAHLPTSAVNNLIWRDIKVYDDHAFIVAESNEHGMQVFDLTDLRGLDPDDAPHTVEVEEHYTGFGRAHNIAINTDAGYAYGIGQREDTMGCGQGLHIVDISDADDPEFAGCYSETGVHDAHCLRYWGPDDRYYGRDLCITSTGGGREVGVVDVTDPANTVTLSRTGYPNSAFSHQGWLLDGHRYYLHGTESTSRNPQTVEIFDLAVLTDPVHIGAYVTPAQSTHHNLYPDGRYTYMSNYKSGLRVFDHTQADEGELSEVGYFDVFPPDDTNGFGFGTWSNYPWFESGVVAIHGYQGLFIVDPRLPSFDDLEDALDDLVAAGGITAGLEAKIRNAIEKAEEWVDHPRQWRIAFTHMERAVHLLLWQADVIEDKNKPNQGDPEGLRDLAALFMEKLVDLMPDPDPPTAQPDSAVFDQACVRGLAGPFPCHNVDLGAFLPNSDLGSQASNSQYGGPGNDSWGWTDPVTGREWVIMGHVDGTSFTDVTNPTAPVVTAWIPRHQTSTLWSDIKVYDDHAFIVKEGAGNGMQVFDLTRLRSIDASGGQVTVAPDAHYNRFGNSHNLHINTDTGFAYAVGTSGNVPGGNPCQTGLHMVDISDPLTPTYAGCAAGFGHAHDVQCVVYAGPDVEHRGKEICFVSDPSGEDTLTIVDVTNKSDVVILSETFEGEPNSYSHQGWLTEDHRYFLHDDESDNMLSSAPGRTRMRVFDVSDLDNPSVQAVHHSETRASAHNLYVDGNLAYLANYLDGLRIADITNIDDPGDGPPAPETPLLPNHTGIFEVGCFDTNVLSNNRPGFGGIWSTYPFFESGNVIISGFDGLFVVTPRLSHLDPGEEEVVKAPSYGCLPFGTMG